MYRYFSMLVQDFFGISQKEARGAIVLSILSLLLLLLPLFSERIIRKLEPVSDFPYSKNQLDSIFNTKFPKNEATVSLDNFSPSLFDPNVAPLELLQQNGIPAHLAQRIINYRSKGGKFRTKNDLSKIYGFGNSLYIMVEPFISIQGATPKSTESFQKSNRPVYSIPKQEIIDINTADTTQLITLRGIASKRANTIIKYRNALGGFYSKEQYKEIYGLDSLALQELMTKTKISTAPTLLHINTISYEDLVKHPYARKNRKFARMILDYRKQNGPFTSKNDLDSILEIDKNYLQQLLPYFQF